MQFNLSHLKWKKIYFIVLCLLSFAFILFSSVTFILAKKEKKRKEKIIHNIFLLLWGIFIFWYAPRLYIYLFIGEGEMKFRKEKRGIGEKYK